MSTTLTDRLTRGTYLFDNGPDRPAVICLTYSWMSDALKVLPHPVGRRVELALSALRKIYPDVDIESHIVGRPLTVSWEDEPHFLGAFKGALPGHYRYNTRMYGHFHDQGNSRTPSRGYFLPVMMYHSCLRGWRAVQTGLNAVWGVLSHFSGRTPPDNPGPGDVYSARTNRYRRLIALPETLRLALWQCEPMPPVESLRVDYTVAENPSAWRPNWPRSPGPSICWSPRRCSSVDTTSEPMPYGCVPIRRCGT